MALRDRAPESDFRVIQYALETDSLAGAAGFEPLHLIIGIAKTLSSGWEDSNIRISIDVCRAAPHSQKSLKPGSTAADARGLGTKKTPALEIVDRTAGVMTTVDEALGLHQWLTEDAEEASEIRLLLLGRAVLSLRVNNLQRSRRMAVIGRCC
jgi:hypothetical protein